MAASSWEEILAQLNSFRMKELTCQREQYERQVKGLYDEKARLSSRLEQAKSLVARLDPSISFDDALAAAEQCQTSVEGRRPGLPPGVACEASPLTSPPTPLLAALAAEERSAAATLELPMPAAADPATTNSPPSTCTADEACTGARWLWEIVGGDSMGGIHGTEEEATDSTVLAVLLSTGALVEQIELNEERLHFRRFTGMGPEEGWISTKLQGAHLAVRADRPPLAPWRPPPVAVGPHGEKPLPVALVFEDFVAPSERYEALRKIDLPAVREMLDVARQIAGFDAPTEEMPMQSTVRRPWLAAFSAGTAGLEKLRVQCPEIVRRAAVMTGIGSGQYAALVAAGVLSFKDALKLVQLRLEVMYQASWMCKQGMVLVIGVELETLWGFCLQARKKEGLHAICQIASCVGPRYFWVSGTKVAVGLVEGMAKKSGAEVRRMIAIAPHTKILRYFQDKMQKGLEEVLPNMRSPLHTVWMQSSAQPMRPGCDPADIAAELACELANPILYLQCKAAMQREDISEVYKVRLQSSPFEPTLLSEGNS